MRGGLKLPSLGTSIPSMVQSNKSSTFSEDERYDCFRSIWVNSSQFRGYFRPESKGTFLGIYCVNPEEYQPSCGEVLSSKHLSLSIWKYFYSALFLYVGKFGNNFRNCSVWKAIKSGQLLATRQQLVGAHHQHACLFKLYTRDAGTSVCNKPISCLRVHARARTAQ